MTGCLEEDTLPNYLLEWYRRQAWVCGGIKMELERQNVLLFSRSTQHGGTENVMVQLCKLLKPVVNRICVCSADGFRTEILEELGVKHYVIPDIERKSPSVIVSVLRRVSEIIRKEQITVIHTHHRMAAFYTFVLSGKYHFVFLNTSHNTFTDKKWLTQLVYRRAKLIACGEMVKRNLTVRYGLAASRITVIHNAAEPYSEKLEPVKMLEDLKAERMCLIGNVGRLSEQKGMKYFLEAIPMVKKEYKKAKFVIVGDGEEKEHLIRLADELAITEDVVFLGYRVDIRNVMRQMDFLVLSSLWEGLPLTPIEAFSVGKTIIATNVDGTPEIVRDHRNGILVESGNAKALAEAMLLLCRDGEMRERLAQEAYRTFLSEFSIEILERKYIQYYKSED